MVNAVVYKCLPNVHVHVHRYAAYTFFAYYFIMHTFIVYMEVCMCSFLTDGLVKYLQLAFSVIIMLLSTLFIDTICVH